MGSNELMQQLLVGPANVKGPHGCAGFVKSWLIVAVSSKWIILEQHIVDRFQERPWPAPSLPEQVKPFNNAITETCKTNSTIMPIHPNTSCCPKYSVKPYPERTYLELALLLELFQLLHISTLILGKTVLYWPWCKSRPAPNCHLRCIVLSNLTHFFEFFSFPLQLSEPFGYRLNARKLLSIPAVMWNKWSGKQNLSFGKLEIGKISCWKIIYLQVMNF